MKIEILHNIRSVYNVGAIFRTCDAVGIDCVVLSGHTPTPIDRFGRARADLHKAAVGAEQFVAWEKTDDVLGYIQEKKRTNFEIIALEQSKKSLDYKKINPRDDCVVVLGSETDGVDPEILDLADTVAEIPMRGKKESLNVSVATGVALYRLFDRN